MSKPNDYVCIGVQEPFVIENINQKCTEYTDKNITKRAYKVADKLNPPVTAVNASWNNTFLEKYNEDKIVRTKIKYGSKMQVGNNYLATLYCDQHFNKFQKMMMKLFFGWRVTNYKEE